MFFRSILPQYYEFEEYVCDDFDCYICITEMYCPGSGLLGLFGISSTCMCTDCNNYTYECV